RQGERVEPHGLREPVVKTALRVDELLEHPRSCRAAHDEGDVVTTGAPGVPEVLELTQETRAVGREPWELVEEQNDLLPTGGAGQRLDRLLERLKRRMPGGRRLERGALAEGAGERFGEDAEVVVERRLELTDHLEVGDWRVLEEPADQEGLAD